MTVLPTRQRVFMLAAAMLLCTAAQAQLFRTYVSSTGSDASPCTLAAPCRLLPAALAAVASGGEIWMLDSANYNGASVVVTKSVTILAIPGAVGSVVATDGAAAFHIATAGVSVTLRNLVMVPLHGTVGAYGVQMANGSALNIEDCTISGMSQAGVAVDTAAKVQVTNSSFRGNATHGISLQNGARASIVRATVSGNGFGGIYVGAYPAGVTTTADIADSTIDSNPDGVFTNGSAAGAMARVSVRRSRLLQNTSGGVGATGVDGSSVAVAVSDSQISNNTAGISVGNNAKVWARGNTIGGNGVGIQNNGGLLESAGDNAIRNNTVDVFGAVAVVATR